MLKLMIVDDEDIIRNSLSQAIDYNALGYELVASAKNGLEAYEFISNEYPDVIITDIRMPFLDGLELIKKTALLSTDIEFIILSGYGDFEYARTAMKYSVRHYLLKPTDPQELIHLLDIIREEKQAKLIAHKKQQHQILSDNLFPLVCSFFSEGLQHEFQSTYHKYDTLLDLPHDLNSICTCSPVSGYLLTSFIDYVHHMNFDRLCHLAFPVIYADNSVKLLLSSGTIRYQEQISGKLTEFFQHNSAKVQIRFSYFNNLKESLSHLIDTAMQSNQISILQSNTEFYEIKNNLTSPKKIEQLVSKIQSNLYNDDIDNLIHSTLHSHSLDIAAARQFVLNTYLSLNYSTEISSLENASNFFGKVNSCTTKEELYHLLRIQVQQKIVPDPHSQTPSYIRLLKEYVENHLQEEELSLKWIAENHLFVSFKYLSKQFVKEEGERFSDYLNRLRMENAKKLLTIFNNDSIKDIAAQIGFGNNPQYFSQVFKRYTGQTPSEFLENNKTTHR